MLQPRFGPPRRADDRGSRPEELGPLICEQASETVGEMEPRVLSSDADAERFLDFVGESFAFRGVPRALFADRLHGDPWREQARIFVIEDSGDGSFLSGLLYYRREVAIEGGAPLILGAVADVCTREDSRRKGLCKTLLLAALGDMAARGFDGSTLHTSQMPPVYSSVGYISVPLRFAGRILPARTSPCCAPADFSSSDQVDALMKLHASFHAHAGFNGCTRRDHPGYWTAYMKTNMQDSGWVFRRVDGEGQAGEIAAFASLKTDRQTLEGFPQGYALADFFASPDEVRRDGGREALLALVQHALASRLQCTTPSKTTPEAGPSRSEAGPSGARPAGRDGPASGGPAGGGPECAPVRFPEALVAHVEGGRANGSNPSDDWWHGAPSFAATHDDTGTMYYPLGPASRTDGPASGTDGPAAGVEGPAAGRLEPLLAGRRHVTFALDSF